MTVVLEQLLGIVVQKEPGLLEAGKRMYDGHTSTVFGSKGSSQGDFVDIVFDQPGLATTYVARHARRLLGADLPKKDLAALADRFRADPDGVRRDRARDRALARLRGRRSRRSARRRTSSSSAGSTRTSSAARRRIRRCATSATRRRRSPILIGIRSVIIRTILDSGSVSLPEKDEDRPGRSGSRSGSGALLFRDPSPSELKTFTEAWKSESCRPATILHAILTSTEYQHY